MEIKITLHGILRDHLPRQAKGKTRLTLPERATVQTVIDQLQLKRGATAVVNNQEVDKFHILQDGDELQLFRLIGGG